MRTAMMRSKRVRKVSPSKSEVYAIRKTSDLAFLVENAMRLDGYSNHRLASEAGVCDATVQRLVDGVTEFPRLDTAVKLLAALGYEVSVSGSDSGRKVSVRDLRR